MENAIVKSENFQNALTPAELVNQVGLVQQVMERVMKKDTHYGTIPGCGDKPTLLKPGAEKLSLTFRLSPQFEIRKTDLPNGHREYEITCTMTHIPTGNVWGQGVGSCSTLESKYRYRGNEIEVLDEPIPKDYKDKKAEYRKNGFGARKIDDQWKWVKYGEKRENPDIADVYNTVLKMAKKRAQVDAILTCTAAGDIFTQDIEDFNSEAFGNTAPAGNGNGENGEDDKKRGRGRTVKNTPPENKSEPPQEKPFNQKEFIKVIHAVKENIKKVSSEDYADTVYKEILGKFGYESSKEVTDRPTADSIYKAMQEALGEATFGGAEENNGQGELI